MRVTVDGAFTAKGRKTVWGIHQDHTDHIHAHVVVRALSDFGGRLHSDIHGDYLHALRLRFAENLRLSGLDYNASRRVDRRYERERIMAGYEPMHDDPSPWREGKPGMDLVEIVPLDDSLMVEARVRPSDIAFLKPGQSAKVKITAYDYATYGMLEAKLEHISADSIIDPQNGEAFYEIRVRTNRNYLQKGEEKHSIIPGMVAEVDILTGTRTVLQYLLKPILRAQQSALRER